MILRLLLLPLLLLLLLVTMSQLLPFVRCDSRTCRSQWELEKFETAAAALSKAGPTKITTRKNIVRPVFVRSYGANLILKKTVLKWPSP